MYNEHLSLHDDSIPKHTCTDCGKEFISLRKLKEHSIIHKERIMFKCEMCSKVSAVVVVGVQSTNEHFDRYLSAVRHCNIIESPARQPINAVNVWTVLWRPKRWKSTYRSTKRTRTHVWSATRFSLPCTRCKITRNDIRCEWTTHAKYARKVCRRERNFRSTSKITWVYAQNAFPVYSTVTRLTHPFSFTESNLKCSVCNEDFQSLVKYGYHKAEMHGLMRPYDCLLCSDQFCTRHELFVHLHNHIGMSHFEILLKFSPLNIDGCLQM